MRSMLLLSFHVAALCVAALACESAVEPAAPAIIEHIDTVRFGTDDNSEVIKLLPDGTRAVLIASKARKLTLLAVRPDGLSEAQSVILFPDDPTESELTHVDFDATGAFAAITRTRPIVTDGAVTDCQGELVFVDVTPGEDFGRIITQLDVGPMPDAVDLSSDDRWAVVADEVDYNDGKCPVAAVQGSVSIVELPNGDPRQARLRAQIAMRDAPDGGRREPEQIIFARDDDRVAVTLQDTHELMFFRRSDLVPDDASVVAQYTLDDVHITRYPNRADGAEPWPDGVHRIVDGAGTEWFVAAGEFNDTFALFSLDGAFERQFAIAPSDLPADLPRNLESWSKAPFRPDSLAPIQLDGRTLLAASLKHAGAIGVWDLSTVDAPTLHSVIKVGRDEAGTPTTESSLGTEGITAGLSDGQAVILCANEGESSASLVRITTATN